MRLILNAVLILILINNLAAQTETKTNENKKAFVFTFSGLNLGGGIGGKYWVSDVSAIALKISGGISKSERDDRVSDDPLSYDSQGQAYTVGCDVTYSRSFLANADVIPYYGISLGIDYDDSRSKTIYQSGAVSERHYTDNFASTSILAGIEVILTNSITFSAEQRISYLSRITKQTNIVSDYHLSSSTSALLLSIYF